MRSEPARHSALYHGTLVHSRHGEIAHQFSRRVALHYLDLDELDALRLAPWFSSRHVAPQRFRARDYFDGTDAPLAPTIRRLVADQLGDAPTGPVRLLTTVRTWGWCFNPITLAYLFNDDGERVEAIVASVTNTPWHERTNYVLDARDGLSALAPVDKRLHVSPFYDVSGWYQFRMSPPAERLRMSITLRDETTTRFTAAMQLARVALTPASTARLLLTHPLASHRITTGIRTQAFQLWRKGVPVVAHPGR